jgi:hypothetical protein
MQVNFAPCEPFVGVASMYRDYEEDLLTTDCETWIPPIFIMNKTALYCQKNYTPERQLRPDPLYPQSEDRKVRHRHHV